MGANAVVKEQWHGREAHSVLPFLQIGNRIKAKGLQKLRWYCQMCQKQCRDENGFKCHLSSDSHRRQMEVFGLNPDRVIDGYSEEFHRTFLEHLNMAYAFHGYLLKWRQSVWRRCESMGCTCDLSCRPLYNN
jgi:hypothetical protein